MDTLVSLSWLASRLHEPDLVVLDATLPPVGVTPRVDTRGRYLERHISGAVFFDIEEHSDHATPLPHMLPSSEAFSRNMGKLGVGDSMRIVIYEQEGVFSAPRAWWMLRTFGARNVGVLDGDLSAWVAAGLPTEAGEVRREEASFHAELDRHAVRDFAQMEQMITARGQIVDARSNGRFRGSAPEPREGMRSGHMPGATNIPFTELAEQGRFKSPDQLRQLFAAMGVDLQAPVTTTCGSGVTAAVIALGLEMAGANKVSLYDGSWAEYGQRPEAKIETGE